MPKSAPDLFRALALLAAAAVCAVVGNAVAGRERKLTWTGWAPAPGAVGAELASPIPPPPAAPVPPPAAPVPRPAPPPSRPAPPAPAAARFAPSADTVIRDLSGADAVAAFRQHIPFLDARRSDEYQAGHVAGAWSVPVWEAEPAAHITEFEARVNPGPKAPIVIYCSGGDCQDSRLLANQLVQLGYRNLFIYRDGYPDWAARHLPTRQGTQP